MSYLKNNNNKIIVDAILTKYGQKKLAEKGTLDIISFRLADDEIDYALYNPSHPQGTDYFDSAIINMPTLEAYPDANMNMLNPLFTTTSVPDVVTQIQLSYPNSIKLAIPKKGVNEKGDDTVTTVTPVSTYDVHNITPNLSPAPSQINLDYFWYKAQCSAALAVKRGFKFEFGGLLNSGKVKNQNFVSAEKNLNSTVDNKFAMGDYFSFKVLQFPTIESYIDIIIWVSGTYASAAKLRIKVSARALATQKSDFISGK